MLAVDGYNECMAIGMPKQVEFYPFDDNGGTLVAIAGDNFVVLASDTRLSSDYSIYSRNQSKLFKLSERTVLGSVGCWCDSLTFAQLLKFRMKSYELEHHHIVDTPAVSQLVSTMMYYKRFFPYYVHNIVAGLDINGKGCVYAYDSIGHKAATTYKAVGSSCALLEPLLDNLIGHKNMDDIPPLFSLNEAVTLIEDLFVSAAERDIYTGDSVLINIITAKGIEENIYSLRKD